MKVVLIENFKFPYFRNYSSLDCPIFIRLSSGHFIQYCNISFHFTGRQHRRVLQFCKCEQESVTLIRYHLWPSSVKCPQLAFHFEFLKWLNGLFVEGHISVKAFCEALKARLTKHNKQFVTSQVKHLFYVTHPII